MSPVDERDFAKAMKLFQADRFIPAEKLFLKVARKNPDDKRCRLLHAWCGLQQSRMNEALVLFADLAELFPESEKASLGLFHSLWALGHKQPALAEMERYRGVNPDSEEYAKLSTHFEVDPDAGADASSS